MTEPSPYELDAWEAIARYRGRVLGRGLLTVQDGIVTGAKKALTAADAFADRHPRVRKAADRTGETLGRGGAAVARTARKAVDAVPDEVTSWLRDAAGSANTVVARVSRLGLTPSRVVKRHRKRGNDVQTLRDVRTLDLERVDAVRGRSAALLYQGVAALSGAGAALTMTGGQMVVVVGAGAAAGPGVGVMAAAVVGDAAAVLAVSSRAVGNVALLYGYDPESPEEKLFILSVVNAGTAATTGAKLAAFREFAFLTQALVRSKTWAVLNTTVLSRVSVAFGRAFSSRLTQQSLGKFVPIVGMAAGAALNWATLENIIDAADVSYRKRFLLEKYPGLVDPLLSTDRLPTKDEDAISLLDKLADAGGPDLRLEDQTS